jgi:predicted chitinase
MVVCVDRQNFFDILRETLFNDSLTREQAAGIAGLLDAWEKWSWRGDDRWLAYMLATVFHETAYTMQPVRETLAATDDRAIEILENAFSQGRLSWVKTPYWRKDEDGRSWLGRGLVQLTHRRNYEAMSTVTGIDLMKDPDRAMETDAAVTILMEGMRLGSFTGYRLADFFSDAKQDWVSARRIVNGTDRAEKIAGYAMVIDAAIRRAGSKRRAAHGMG